MGEFDARPTPSAGQLDQRVVILRRAVGSGPGQERGAFAPALKRWASWRFTAAKGVIEAGRSSEGAEGKFILRDDAETRLITHADRVLWRGAEWSVVSVSPPGGAWPFIEIFVSRARNGGLG